MIHYQRILVAVELIPKSDALIIQRTNELKDMCKEVFLIHAVEGIPNYGAAYGVVVGVDLEQTLQDEAKKSLMDIGLQLNIPVENQLLHLGSPNHAILEEAKAKKVDLILLGSHGRHGVRLLLGSTANSVLHGAECDVLAVRLPND